MSRVIQVECSECQKEYSVSIKEIDVWYDEWYTEDDYGYYTKFLVFCPFCERKFDAYPVDIEDYYADDILEGIHW